MHAWQASGALSMKLVTVQASIAFFPRWVDVGA
jgi:hypothetical protein